MSAATKTPRCNRCRLPVDLGGELLERGSIVLHAECNQANHVKAVERLEEITRLQKEANRQNLFRVVGFRLNGSPRVLNTGLDHSSAIRCRAGYLTPHCGYLAIVLEPEG